MQQSAIYISYHEPDFQSERSHFKNWMDGFIDTLEVLFIQSHSQTPLIHHSGNGAQNNEMQIVQADAFIAVITENYHTSKKCMAELDIYYARKPDMNSIFKVIRKPLANDLQPNRLVCLPAYEFFEYDADSEIMVEYNNMGRLPDYKYWVKLDDLAHSVLYHLDGGGKGCVGVYLASTTIDQKPVRDALARNLKHRGFAIFPRESYDVTDTKLKEKVLENLERCSLSIHLMGEVFGEVINEEGDSLVSLENEIALRYSLDHPSLKRIVRVPRGLQVMETKQQTYLEYLRSHKELQSNSYYLETSLENLKAYMHDLLNAPYFFEQSDQWKSLFFATSSKNDWLDRIDEVLEDTKVELLTSSDFESWSEHQVSLGNADTLLLMDVPHNRNWVANWMKTLHKLKGYRTKSVEIRGILISDQPDILSELINPTKFKVVGIQDFEQNPKQLLDMIH